VVKVYYNEEEAYELRKDVYRNSGVKETQN